MPPNSRLPLEAYPPHYLEFLRASTMNEVRVRLKNFSEAYFVRARINEFRSRLRTERPEEYKTVSRAALYVTTLEGRKLNSPRDIYVYEWMPSEVKSVREPHWEKTEKVKDFGAMTRWRKPREDCLGDQEAYLVGAPVDSSVLDAFEAAGIVPGEALYPTLDPASAEDDMLSQLWANQEKDILHE